MAETQQAHDSEIVQRWLSLLRQSQTSEAQLKAATELARHGIRTRGAPVARGTLRSAATARVPEAATLTQVLEELSVADPDVQAEVAVAVGEWCDESAVKILTHMATQNAISTVRMAAVDALAKIGGSDAVEILMTVAKDDEDELVRARAVDGLGSLAEIEHSEPPRTFTAIRTCGAVRTRGAGALSPEAKRLVDMLSQLREQDRSSYVRNRAGVLLKELTE